MERRNCVFKKLLNQFRDGEFIEEFTQEELWNFKQDLTLNSASKEFIWEVLQFIRERTDIELSEDYTEVPGLEDWNDLQDWEMCLLQINKLLKP